MAKRSIYTYEGGSQVSKVVNKSTTLIIPKPDDPLVVEVIEAKKDAKRAKAREEKAVEAFKKRCPAGTDESCLTALPDDYPLKYVRQQKLVCDVDMLEAEDPAFIEKKPATEKLHAWAKLNDAYPSGVTSIAYSYSLKVAGEKD